MSETPFDFTAMQAQGAAAGIPVLYVLTMTPLPLARAGDTTLPVIRLTTRN